MTMLQDLWMFAIIWYNLPFTLALGAFLALAGLQLIGLGGESDADMDADFDLDADFDMDADADMDIHADTDGFHGFGLLEFLGVGQAPITMLLLVMSGSFGFIGFFLNRLVLNNLLSYPTWAILPVLAVALVGSLIATSYLGRLIGRAVPALSTTATSVKQLVGHQARVVSPQITETYGQIKVRDKGGTLLTMFAVTDPNKPPISYNETVLLVEYDDKRKVFVVVSEK